MTRPRLLVFFFVGALACGMATLAATRATLLPVIAQGTGPDGVSITAQGWLSLAASLLGTGGFTVASLITVVATRLGISLPEIKSEQTISEIIELSASFTALLKNRSHRATQRRFVFALVDAARLIEGCETSHENGVVILKYSGYADAAQPISKEE